MVKVTYKEYLKELGICLLLVNHLHISCVKNGGGHFPWLQIQTNLAFMATKTLHHGHNISAVLI